MWLKNIGQSDRGTAAASMGGSGPAGSRTKIRKAAHRLPVRLLPPARQPRRATRPAPVGAIGVAAAGLRFLEFRNTGL